MSTTSDVDFSIDAPCGLLTFSADGIILQVNSFFSHIVKIDSSELKGKSIESVLTIASRIFYQTHFFPLFKMQGAVDEIFLQLQLPDRTNVPVLVNGRRKATIAGDVYVCVFIPVSQRGKYEEEILRAKRDAEKALHENKELIIAKQESEEHQQELDHRMSKLQQLYTELVQFNQLISHDLLEPLRKIVLFIDLLILQSRDRFNSKDFDLASRITKAAIKMRNLIVNLQEYVSLDTKERTVALVDLNHTLEIARNKLLSLKPKAEVIKSNILPTIEGYSEQLQLLFYHLLDNAAKFNTNAIALVQVSSSITQRNSFTSIEGKYRYLDFVKIEIVDNGIGIEEKYSEYIFQMLKKVNPDTEGLGFGLALCKKIAENHYGTITAKPGIGGGSMIEVYLPVHQNPLSSYRHS